jgi:hypothetical protein
MASPCSGTAPPPLKIGTLLEHTPFQAPRSALHLGQRCRSVSILRSSHVSRTLAYAMMRWLRVMVAAPAACLVS